MLIKLTTTDVKFMTSDNDFCTEHLFISATVSKYHSFAETFLYPNAIAQYSLFKLTCFGNIISTY